MRLLAISYMLPPALYPQAIQIGRLLAHSGSELGLVCGALAGAAGPAEDFVPAARLAFRLEVGFRPRLSGLPFNLARRFVPFYARIPDEYRAWVPLAQAATLAELRRSRYAPDLVVTFGEPMSDHLLGLRLKAELGLPWVAHFSDPWADNPFRRNDHLANIVNRRLEADVVAHADHLIFTSRETIRLVMGKYSAAAQQKCSVLPHSFDRTLYAAPQSPGSGAVVRYLGNFYGHRTPLPLFRALQLILRTEPDALRDVRFELIGRLPGWTRKHPAFRSLPPGLVQLVPSVSYAQSLKLMSQAHLLLVIDAPADESVFLPSKLIDYIGAGIPIFGIVPPGASANLLERLGGLVADPRDAGAMAEGLAQSLRRVRERSSSPSALWGAPAVRAEFTAERVAGDFRSILAAVVM
jgi:glycosyltransferase involved in cell wall biosynthesis